MVFKFTVSEKVHSRGGLMVNYLTSKLSLFFIATVPKKAYLYLLIEDQSTPDRFMPVRLLRYQLNLLGKYLDVKRQPKKLPNIISLVIYNGEKVYPYPKEISACFEDSILAEKSLKEPMLLLDLVEVSEDELVTQKEADTILKLLLKWSRDRDLSNYFHQFMVNNKLIFVNLSVEQSYTAIEYALFMSKGNPQSAKKMEEAIQQTYGAQKAKKFFSLVDFYKEEGEQKGEQKGILTVAKKMLKEGEKEEKITKFTGLSSNAIKKLQKNISNS